MHTYERQVLGTALGQAGCALGSIVGITAAPPPRIIVSKLH